MNFVDPSGMEKKWIKENEGNAWYIYTSNFSDLDTGHAMLYYIYNGEEKVISFQPLNFDNGFFFNNESIFDTGKSEIIRAKSYINTGSSTLITKENINISGVDNWFSNQLNNKPDYNTFTNNCTTEVKKALLSGGIFLISTDTPWGLKIALDVYL